MYGTSIIMYLFLGGTASGVLLFGSCYSIFCRAKNNLSVVVNSANTFFLKIYLVGFTLLLTGVLFLMNDLGKSSRFYYVFLFPHPTIITFGSFVLTINLLISGLLSFGNLFSPCFFKKNVQTVLEFICSLLSLFTMLYPALLLMNYNVALWESPTLLGLFAFSSLSSGLCVIFIIATLCSSSPWKTDFIINAQRLHLLFIFFESLFLLIFLLVLTNNPTQSALHSLELILSPNNLFLCIIGVLGAGIIIPSVTTIFLIITTKGKSFIPFDIICLLGGLSLRYCIIICGVH